MASKNFFKQFDYLYKTSCAIIHEFGIRYFLRFGISQIKNQKLDLLKLKAEYESKSIPEKIIDKKTQYDLWIKKQKLHSSIDVEHFTLKPKICFIILLPKSITTLSIKNSIQSIFKQSYANWELLILTTKATYEQVQNLIISQSYDEQKIKTIQIENTDNFSLTQLSSYITGDFVSFLTPEITIISDCLNYFVSELNDFPTSDLLYSDEERISENGSSPLPFFKPDWSPYLLQSINYIGNFFFIRKTFLLDLGKTHNFGVESIFNLFYICSEHTHNIHHISKILFASSEKNLSDNTYSKIILNSLQRKNISSKIRDNLNDQKYKIDFDLNNEPKVSIIIPTKNNKTLLSKCIRSLEYNTNYKNFEIIIVDNNSQEDETKSYLSSLPYTVLNYDDKFNFSKINNLAVSKSSGEYLLFLNDDTEALVPNWLHEMVSICQQKDVGAVGAKLLYNDKTIQHAGMVFLKNGFFFHPFHKKPSKNNEEFNLINTLRECSSVTGACLLTKRKIFDDVKGFDELFDVYYGDSDLCFKIRKLEYSVIFTPFAILHHDGSSTIREQSKIFIPVENFYDFVRKWPNVKNGDPYYNPNFLYDYSLDLSN
jgi:O-antigen biosynthesis protein